jgi:hypothetical protein
LADYLRRELERASKAVPRSMWKASRECRDMARAASKMACAEIGELRAMINELETLAAKALAPQVPPAPSQPDNTAPTKGTGSDGGVNWVPWVGFFFAGLVVGFCIRAMPGGRAAASRRVAPTSQDASMCPSSSNAPSRNRVPGETSDSQPDVHAPSDPDTAQAGPDTARGQVDSLDDNYRLRNDPPSWNNPGSTLQEAVEVWMCDCLREDSASQIAARDAFKSFCELCAEEGWRPPSETAFGRELTAQIKEWGIKELGISKVKKRTRAYYQGVAFSNTRLVILDLMPPKF